MIDLFSSGGWFMWPLLVCSICVVSIAIERFWMLQERLVAPQGLSRQIHNLIDRDILDDYQERVFSELSSLGSLLITAYQFRDSPRQILESKLEEKSVEIKFQLERNLSMLGVISSVAPLLGLLGTVVGMISVFASYQMDPANTSDFLASGISQALITTAFGLMIAVPGIILHRHFELKVNKLLILLQVKTSQFIDG